MNNDKAFEKAYINLRKASTFMQNIAGMVDAAVVIIAFIALSNYLPQNIISYLQSPMRPEIFILIFFALYRLFFLFIFTDTIGMRLTRIRLLNQECKALSAKEKISAAF